MNKKPKRKLYDLVNSKYRHGAIGVLICLFAIFGALNQGVVSQTVTWIVSFFVGGIFSFLVYIIIFLYGLSFIFYSKRKKINFDITILGFILILLGMMILVTNSMSMSTASDGSLEYLTFKGDSFKSTFDLSFAFNNFPVIDFTKNSGIISLIIVAAINSGMTYIGSYVIGSILICCGLVLSLTKALIKFKSIIVSYHKNVLQDEKRDSYKEASDLSLDKSIIKEVKVEEPIEAPSTLKEVDKSQILEEKKDFSFPSLNDLPSSFENTGLIKASFDLDKSSNDKAKDEVIRNNLKVEETNDDSFSFNDSKKEDGSVSSSFISTQNISEEIKADEIKKEEVLPKEKEIIPEEIKSENIVFKNDYSEIQSSPIVANNLNITKALKKEENTDIISKITDYEYPNPNLLISRQNDTSDEANKVYAEECIEIINKLCRDFSFGAHIESYQIGPSVTRYDLKADENTQSSKFSNYIDELSVRLSGVNARFEPIVKGKTCSGIEVKNAKSNIVDFKDVFEHLPPLNHNKYNGLMIPFGKDISGNYISADLRDFPHVLICGTTGSGKSIFMQTMIMTMIMRNSPEDLRLFIIDPKRVEFSKYRDIPHLLGPICSEPTEAYTALNNMVDIMENRYHIFEESEVTDIKEYNKDYAPAHHLKKLPYIVCVIDEYSNLVDGCKRVSEPVLSIAQKARACGIHLIIATQAPRTSIITGVIKANLPTRVALLCANSTDSQNVIDVGGAERLLGNGDMLIKSPCVSTAGLSRVQGAYVEPKEIKAVVEFLRNRYPSDYNEEFTHLQVNRNDDNIIGANSFNGTNNISHNIDPLYDEVKSYAMTMEYFSISKIARTYGMGYNRAGKIFDQLKNEGILDSNENASNNSKGTRVLVHSSSFSNSTNPGSNEQSTFDNTDFKNIE